MSQINTQELNVKEQEISDPPIVEFESGVLEYQEAETKALIDFAYNVANLGKILKKQRDKWKPEKLWTEYLNRIGKTLPYANQCIRWHEYNELHPEAIPKLKFDNWYKINLFLALTDNKREEVVELVPSLPTENGVVSNTDFSGMVSSIKDRVEEKGVEEKEMVEIQEEKTEWGDIVKTSSFSDIPFLSKKVLEELNGVGYAFSENCLVIIEGFLSLSKATKDLEKEQFKKLSPGEKKFWKKKLGEQLEILNKLI